MGQLGYNSDEFWSLTPLEFWLALEGNFDREQERQREEWIRQRYFTWWLVNIQLSKDQKVELLDIIRFDWEKQKEIDLPTEDDIRRIKERDLKLWQK